MILRAYSAPALAQVTGTAGEFWSHLIDELKTMCVEGLYARSALNLAIPARISSVLCNDRKLHLLDEPKLQNLDIGNRHYFAQVILTRTVEPLTISSTFLAIGDLFYTKITYNDHPQYR